MSSDIFMHDISNPEDEFLWIRSEQDKMIGLLSGEDKKLIQLGRSLHSSERLAAFVAERELKEKIKLVKYLAPYLPLEEQAKLIRSLGKEERHKLIKSLPAKLRQVLSGWRSMKANVRASQEETLFLQFFDTEEKIRLVKYLELAEQEQVFEYMKHSRNQIWLFKSLPEDKQERFFKHLQDSDEKFRYFRSLDPEKRKKLYSAFEAEEKEEPEFKKGGKYIKAQKEKGYSEGKDKYPDEKPVHPEQLHFFQALDSSEQVKLYEELETDDKARVCKALPSEDQSRIFNSLQHAEQIKLLAYLNPAQQLIFFKYLEEEERTELYYELSPTIKRNVFPGLPEDHKYLIQEYLSLKNAQDPQIIFFKSLDDGDQKMLYNFLKEDEQEKLADCLKTPIETEAEVTERGIPTLPTDKTQEWEAQYQAYQNLKGISEQAKFFSDLDGEDSRSLFRKIDKHEQQIELFKALGSEKQIALFTNLDSEEKKKLYKSLPEKALHLLEEYIDSKNKHLEFFIKQSEADQIRLYRSLEEEDKKKLKQHFNQSHIDLFNASRLMEQDAGFLIDHAREDQMLAFSELADRDEQLAFFENLGAEDARFLFINIQDPDLQIDLFKDLTAEKQDRLYRSLQIQDQDKVFVYLKNSREQTSSFHTMKWEEKISFFESLDWETKTELFAVLNPREHTWLLYSQEDQLKLFNGLPNSKQHALLDAMENELDFLREMQSSRKRWEIITNSGEKIEKNLEHFYSYQFHHPRFLQIVVGVLGIAAMLVCLNFTFNFFNKEPVPPIYNKIEGIKRLGEMHLVKQQYESVIPITKQKENRRGDFKKEKLQFLLIAPIEVTGYIDFGGLDLQILKDSVMEITLPEPQISKAYLDFTQTEEFRTEGKFRVFGQYIERMNHKEAYYDIARGINNAKERVRKSAEMEHYIKEETQEKAYTFLRNFGSTLGYRVQFRVETEGPPSPSSAADSTATASSAEKDEEEGFSLLSRLSDFTSSVLNK